MSRERRRWEPVTADDLEALTDEDLEDRLGITERLDLRRLEESLFGEMAEFRERREQAQWREGTQSKQGRARVIQLDPEDVGVHDDDDT